MINRIEINAFKTLEHIAIELGNVNIFVGGNGSGKSNILEAIGILSAAAAGRVDDAALLTRGVRPGIQALYKCSFPDFRSNHISFSAFSEKSENMPSASYAASLFNPLESASYIWQYHTEKLKFGNNLIVGRSHRSKEKKDFSQGLAAYKMADTQEDDRAFDILRVLRPYAIYTPNTDFLRGIIPEQVFQRRLPVGLHGGGLADAFVEFRSVMQSDRNNITFYKEILHDIGSLIDWASSFGFRTSEKIPISKAIPASRFSIAFTDRFMKSSRNVLSGYDASEGALYVLFHAFLAALPSAPAFYAVDNADHSLNPRLCRQLFAKICKWILNSPAKKQVLMTTHNPLALDGIPLLDDRVRLFTVSRSASGRTVIRRVLWNEKMEELRKNKRLSLSQLWLSGELGGMPDEI